MSERDRYKCKAVAGKGEVEVWKSLDVRTARKRFRRKFNNNPSEYAIEFVDHSIECEKID